MSLSRDTTGSAAVYQFELTLDSPITGLINDGRAYWLEVSNASSFPSAPHCYWHWSRLAPGAMVGNDYSAQGEDSGYWPAAERTGDYAFCVNLDIAPGGMGPVEHPCCHCDGSCEMLTLAQCDQGNGTWDVTSSSCNEVSCPTGAPANDTCPKMQILNSGTYVFNTTCAGTENIIPVPSDSGPVVIGKDVWFSFLHEFDCYLSFSTCASDFDTVIALYFDPDNPFQCPCPNDENLDHLLIASDEGCAGANLGGGGFLRYNDFCDAAPFGCLTIRVGGFEGDSGSARLDVSCSVPEQRAGGIPPPPPQPIAGDLPKVRFLSLQFPQLDECGNPLTDPVAFRVNMVSLHHVSPPYTGGPSIPFTSFEGQSRWIGPPQQYYDCSSFCDTPFNASFLQCAPHYQDWSTIGSSLTGRLHVTGSAIVPSSEYNIETVPSACQGFEGGSTCIPGGFLVSSPLQLKTARWADVDYAYNPPDSSTQPDFGDIAALVNRFRNAPGAPIKARALLMGNDMYGNISTTVMTMDLNFSHIAGCVDAFKGRPYPHTIQACP